MEDVEQKRIEERTRKLVRELRTRRDVEQARERLIELRKERRRVARKARR